MRFARTAAGVATALALGTAGLAQTPSVGLSSVGVEHLTNPFAFAPSAAGDRYAHALASGDFNGDGADDLAIGSPLLDWPSETPLADAGLVFVRYGEPPQGPPADADDGFLVQSPEVNPPEEDDYFGLSLASCDFNGDGFDDLAVGIPLEDHVGREDTGGVQIHYGGSEGLPAVGHQFYAQSTPGMPGDAEDGDLFGYTLACGDFDSDGFADLVIGVPDEKIGLFRTHAGMVDIVPGTAFGLAPAAASYLSQEVAGMGGDAEIQDYFGDALAVGDFNGDGFADLAIGSPGEDHFTGAIHMVFGGPAGLNPTGSLFLQETSLGGSSEEWDEFGNALTTADFDGDGFDDLVVGIPFEDLGPGGSTVNAGRVCVLYGAPTGYDPGRTQFWTEGDLWGPVATESGDWFGLALAAGDFDKDGFADLAVGHPHEDDLGVEDGSVTVFMGSGAGLSAARRQSFAAGVEGLPGDPTQDRESFAYSLASGDFDGDGHADLAAGSPYEDVQGFADAGADTVLYGALFADGFESGGTAIWSQTVGTPGGNRVRATADAALGPRKGGFGLQVALFNPSRGTPSTPAFVKVGSEVGFRDEATLRGSFFIDPRGVTMSPLPGLNDMELMRFTDGPARGDTPRLALNLNREPPAGGDPMERWVLVATSFNESVGAPQFAAGVLLGPVGDPELPSYRIEFEWKAAPSNTVPGQLTFWKTRFVNRVPDKVGRVLVGTVDLPGTVRAVINDVAVGMIAGQDAGTSGLLAIDELSFRR